MLQPSACLPPPPRCASRTWPYAEVSPFDHGKFYQIFRMASIVWADSSYEAMIPALTGNVNYGANTIDLIWPKGALRCIRPC